MGNWRDKQWKGGPRSSRSYKMDYYRQAKDEDNTPGIVHPHYRAKPKGGSTTVRGHHRIKHRR